MQIGDLAAAAGTTPRPRYYEQCGLPSPSRTCGGYRSYASSDVERVRKIRALLEAGLGTTVMASVLP